MDTLGKFSTYGKTIGIFYLNLGKIVRKPLLSLCKQQKFRSPWVMQSYQQFYCSLPSTYWSNSKVKTLIFVHVYAKIDVARVMSVIIERRCEKTCFLYNAKTKVQISCAVTAQLISAFVFATKTV